MLFAAALDVILDELFCVLFENGVDGQPSVFLFESSPTSGVALQSSWTLFLALELGFFFHFTDLFAAIRMASLGLFSRVPARLDFFTGVVFRC